MSNKKEIFNKLYKHTKQFEKHLVAGMSTYYDPYEDLIDELRATLKQAEKYINKS